MSRFDDSDLTRNAFLGGKLQLWQPRNGYRAGVDPLFLAACVPARAGQGVLELGCGAGTAILSLAVRVPGLRLHGVELQPAYAQLAQRNAADNQVDLHVTCADLNDLPDGLRAQQFDHVIANPPYYRAGAHTGAADPGRRTALGEMTPLRDWIDAATRRLTHKGYLHVIQRADRLPDLLAACDDRLGSVEVLPLAPRVARAPELLILRARKGGRAAFRLHAPFILHRSISHERDADDYMTEIKQVLREAAALPWPGL